MNPAAFNDWSASVTSLAVMILWQSTPLAALVAGVCWLLKRSTPALRYWCWQIVALKLLLMPWWIVAVPLPSFMAENAAETSPGTSATTEKREQALGISMDGLTSLSAEAAEVAVQKMPGLFGLHRRLSGHSWLVVVWLAGIAWQVGRLAVECGRLRRHLSRATTASDPRLLAQIEDVAVRLGLSRRPRVVLTEDQGAPFVCGLFRPLLALPRGLAEELDAAQLRDVLLHEFAHLKRRDLMWGWLPALARTIYFFHPAAHWVGFRIRLERELACDQLAMALGGRGTSEYAEVLFQVISRASMPAPLAASSLEGLSTFWRRRLTMLVSASQSSPRLSRVSYLGLASAALAACLLPTFRHAPVQAQDSAAAKAEGRIYVSASYRIKPEGAGEEKTIHNVIISIDPATGDWQLVVENGYAARLSPDRRTLVFNRHDDGIWKCEADGQYPFKISDQNGRPVWSPDGKQFVVTKQEDLDKDNVKDRTTPAWKCETWRIDADGRNAVKAPIPDTDWVADWCPDGQWFVAGTDRHRPYGRGYQLYLMKTDGTEERRLTHDGLNVYSRISPNGKKVLYVHQTRAEGNSIWTVDVDGENATEICQGGRSLEAGRRLLVAGWQTNRRHPVRLGTGRKRPEGNAPFRCQSFPNRDHGRRRHEPSPVDAQGRQLFLHQLARRLALGDPMRGRVLCRRHPKLAFVTSTERFLVFESSALHPGPKDADRRYQRFGKLRRATSLARPADRYALAGFKRRHCARGPMPPRVEPDIMVQ